MAGTPRYPNTPPPTKESSNGTTMSWEGPSQIENLSQNSANFGQAQNPYDYTQSQSFHLDDQGSAASQGAHQDARYSQTPPILGQSNLQDSADFGQAQDPYDYAKSQSLHPDGQSNAASQEPHQNAQYHQTPPVSGRPGGIQPDITIAGSDSSGDAVGRRAKTTPETSPSVSNAHTAVPQTIKQMHRSILHLDGEIFETNAVVDRQQEEIDFLRRMRSRETDRIASLESRVEALEERNGRLERLIRESGVLGGAMNAENPSQLTKHQSMGTGSQHDMHIDN